jgi:hypothetical protein
MTSLFVTAIGSGLLMVLSLLLARAVGQARLASTRVGFSLRFPIDLDAQAVESFVRGLAGLLPPRRKRIFALPAVVFELRADHDGIGHRMLVPRRLAGFVCSQLRAAVPGVRISGVQEFQSSQYTLAGELRLRPTLRLLNIDHPEAVSSAILSALQPLAEGEGIAVQMVIAPGAPRSSQATLKRRSGRSQLANEDLKDARAKNSRPGFPVALRLGATAGSRERSRQLLAQLTSVFHMMNAPGAHFERRGLPSSLAARNLVRGAVPLAHLPCHLSDQELVPLLGWPIGSVGVAGLALAGCRELAPSVDIPSSGRVIATATFPGAERPLALSDKDSLRHLHLLGPTGTGKSTAILNLAVRDLEAGAGLVLIDPKGDLVTDLLDRIPQHRMGDVIVLDPTDVDRPVGLNPLEAGPRDIELVADQVVGIFHALFSSFWGPRTADCLRAALLTLLVVPGYTLCEISTILTDESFRRRLTAKLDDSVLEGFWGWYENLGAAERTQAIGPVLNKLRHFTLSRRIRNIIGQSEPALDLEAVVSEGKVLLVSLSRGLLGEESASLLGSLLVARLWGAIQARASLPAGDRKPIYGYIDEVQSVLNLPTSLEDLLAQARGFGFGVTLAHQHLQQLPTTLRQAVLANCKSKVCFQLSASDASVMAKEFAPYLSAEDLKGLGPYEVVLQLSAGNRVAPPATGVTAPPAPANGRADQVRTLSRDRYGVARSEVEREIRFRQEGRAPSAPIGRRRRG